MINHVNQGAGADAESRSDAISADRLMSSKNIAGEAVQTAPPKRSAAPRNVMHKADMRGLEAHVERRSKLAARIKLENPSRTEEEIEARLEQFGA